MKEPASNATGDGELEADGGRQKTEGDGPERVAAMQDLHIEVEGRTITLRDETVVEIGRDVPDGISVRGDAVSRVHAELRRNGPTWMIIDLESLNGTFIDGKRIGEQRICAPVTVHLGPPESGTSLVIEPVSAPRADGAAKDGTSPAYAETMVADAIVDPDQDDDAQSTGAAQDDESEPTGPRLVVQVGTARVQFPHPTTVSIGRMPDNDVVIADLACSRIHGYVEPTADGWTYRNVSEHGTFHREELIESITLGDVPIVLKLGDPDAGPNLELAHLGMSALVPEPSDLRPVFQLGRHRISRRLVYGAVVVALYLALAAWAVGYLDR